MQSVHSRSLLTVPIANTRFRLLSTVRSFCDLVPLGPAAAHKQFGS